MSEDPENLVLQILRGMRGDIGKLDEKVDRLRADVASDLASMQATMQKETCEQIAALRRAVVEYHSSVVGHGLFISEHEDRIRRIEDHLNLPPRKTG